MGVLILGLVVFFGVHSVAIVAPAWRDAKVARHEGRWKGLYSLVSLVGLVLIVYGFGIARASPTLVWAPPLALRHVSLLLMVPVFPLLFATYLPGRISAAARHPMLLATKIWALAHLLSNGFAHEMLLFGAFLVWAVADRIAVKRRAVARTVPGAPPRAFNDVIAVVGGLATYVAFLFGLHRWFFGVSPLA